MHLKSYHITMFSAESKTYMDVHQHLCNVIMFFFFLKSEAHRPEGIEKPLHTVGRLISQNLNASFHLYHKKKTDNNIIYLLFFFKSGFVFVYSLYF